MSSEAFRAIGYFLIALGLVTVLAYVWAAVGWRRKR